MHDELEILDVEKKTGTFQVVFEVPGKHYDQSYPKRLRHTFQLREKWFEEVELDSGESVNRFEKYLIDNYLESGEVREERGRAEKRLEESRGNVKGRSHSKRDTGN